jgi:serine/threonine-protein kinase
VILAKVWAQKAEYTKAIEMARSAVELSGDDPVAACTLAHILALAKQSREANEILDELQRSRKRRYISAGNIATIYIGLDKKQLAFDWLEKAYQNKDIEIVWLKVSPVFDPLRPDPRFTKLLERVSPTE